MATPKPWCQNITARMSRILLVCIRAHGFYGAAKRIRTPDPRITNALLYQLSYCGTR
jgi:hypothetical protein